MSSVLIIDDDAALDLIAENLRFRGFDVQRISSASQVLDSLDELIKTDFIILDILMDIPESKIPIGQLTSGIRSVGMHIHKLIRQKNTTVPILVYSGCNDATTVELINNDPHSRFLTKWSMPNPKDIAEIIGQMLGAESVKPSPNMFIVHGHNDALKLELKNYLQNTLHLKEPIILHEKQNMGRTIIEKFEDYAYSSNVAFVLLTPDDQPAKSSDNDEAKRHARQNVILELGFFLGNLGRETGRVILLHVGPIELPSDLSGVTYIDVSKGVEAAGEEIRRELNNVSRQSLSWRT